MTEFYPGTPIPMSNIDKLNYQYYMDVVKMARTIVQALGFVTSSDCYTFRDAESGLFIILDEHRQLFIEHDDRFVLSWPGYNFAPGEWIDRIKTLYPGARAKNAA